MDDFLSHWYANGTLLVMWGALIANFFLPLPRAVHPMLIWQKFALILSDKVNTSTHYSQQLLSGTLAWMLMCLPAAALFIALQPLVWHPQLFQLALLMLALDWRNNNKLAKTLISALAQDSKAKARLALQPFVNRDTSPLSQLGLGKAGAETLVMSYGRNVIGVLFWYALLGGIGAFLYRMMVELARTWSPSRDEFSPFGLPAIKILAVLDFVPMRLFASLVSIGQRAGYALSLIRQQASSWPLPGPSWLLIAVGGKLQLSLGGPAMYRGKKRIRSKIGGRIAPSAIHLAQIKQLLAWRIIIWIVIQSCLLGVIYQGI